jgi:hypothetical protein
MILATAPAAQTGQPEIDLEIDSARFDGSKQAPSSKRSSRQSANGSMDKIGTRMRKGFEEFPMMIRREE